MPVGDEALAGIESLKGGIDEGTKVAPVYRISELSIDLHEESRSCPRDLRRRGAKRRRISSSLPSIGWSSGDSVITRAYRESSAAAARTSPCSDLAISDLISARCLVTRQ